MRYAASLWSRGAAIVSFALLMVSAAGAQTPVDALAGRVAQIEARLGGRIGLSLVATGSDWAWAYRGDDRFLMNSTVKTLICGAVLARHDAGTLSLSDTLRVTQKDILSYAPVTKRHVGQDMSLADLCLATLDQSDNTAANLLIDHLGGPAAVTTFLRGIGDEVSRLDRREPDLNTFAPGDPRDTTTPTAMTATLRALLLGGALSPVSRDQLADWMRHGGVTGNLLRADAPKGWRIFDKSGSGSHTRNLIAMVQPAEGSPWLIAIFISDAKVDFQTRNAALQEIGGAVLAVIQD